MAKNHAFFKYFSAKQKHLKLGHPSGQGLLSTVCSDQKLLHSVSEVF